MTKPESKNHECMCKIGQFWFDDWTMPIKSVNCLRTMESYYTEDNIKNILYPIVKKKFNVSCRTLEYACVNYAKRHNVVYMHEIDGEETLVYLSDEYNRWLDQWNRPNFDFFRRYAKIYFQVEDEILETTVGQAHIFYWAEKYGVIKYVLENLDDICRNMSMTHGQNRKIKQRTKLAGKQRKRHKLVTTPKSQCFIYEVNVHLSFNNFTSNENEEYQNENEEYQNENQDKNDKQDDNKE